MRTGATAVILALLMASAGCGGDPVEDAASACERAADQVGPDFTVAGAFSTTVRGVLGRAAWDSSSDWYDLPPGDAAYLCYLYGGVPKSPPDGDPYDVAVVGVTAGHIDLIMAGYQDQVEIVPPR